MQKANSAGCKARRARKKTESGSMKQQTIGNAQRTASTTQRSRTNEKTIAKSKKHAQASRNNGIAKVFRSKVMTSKGKTRGEDDSLGKKNGERKAKKTMNKQAKNAYNESVD